MTGLNDNVTDDSTVVLHRLAFRPDGTETIIGRIDTGDFIAVPAAGTRAAELLAQGATVEQTQRRVLSESREVVDVASFVRSLITLGFVAELDGQGIAGPPPISPSLPRLRPDHVRWLLSTVTHSLVAALILIGIGLIALGQVPPPSYQALLWHSQGSLVLLGQLTVAWMLIGVHELAHLAMARAAGVPGRIGLSTRLQFLVAQTDISGMWAVERRHRLATYAAGMAVDMLIAAIAAIASAAVGGDGPVHHAAMVLITIVFLSIPLELLIFMRTDVYFIFQDLARCRNLYADGTAYAAYHVRRIRRFLLRRTAAAPDDPSLRLDSRERHAVRLYTVVLVFGSAACIGVAILITVPFQIHLIANAVDDMAAGRWAGVVDGALVLLALGSVYGLWMRAWWRRHGHKVRRRISHMRWNQHPS